MPQNKEEKKATIEKLEKSIEKQKSMVFTNYKGLKASDIFKFRTKLREKGCAMTVTKKTLLKLALKNQKIDYDPKELEGQLALVFGFEDEVSSPKIVYQFSKENNNLKILGGFLENKFITSEGVASLAMIPSKEELLAKVVGSIASPISGFVNALQGNLRNLVYVLSAIKK
jgi:large subunit ribosomal protein L10